jgi:hypothetical protein
VQIICLLADIRAFGKCVLFGFWISEFVCFDLIPGSRAERWRVNSTDAVAEETPNCDGEVSVLKFCRSF